MRVSDSFSEQDLAAVRDATRRVEAATGGELVCTIVERCDSYDGCVWMGATMGSLGGALVAGVWQSLSPGWGSPILPWILLPPALGAALAILLVLALEPLQRALVPARLLDRRVDRRAAAAFLAEDLASTRDRTGVLIFLALFEHRIRILRDVGVEAKVPAAAWEPIIDQLAADLRRGRAGAGLLEAVDATGRLLAAHQVARRPDDRNELSDQPRVHRE